MTTEALLSDWAVVAVRGPDAGRFLQAQLTSDVDAVTPTQGQISAWCSPNGRVRHCFYLLHNGSAFLLLIPNGDADTLVPRLRMFVLRAAVEIEDLSARCRVFGEALVPAAAAAPRFTVVTDGAAQLLTVSPSGRRLRVAAGSTAAAGAAADTAAQHAWLLADIEDGLPVVSAASAEQFLPQMLNLDVLGGLSFTKGCFPGQEVIARMKYRGQLKQRLQCFEAGTESPIAPDTPLYFAGERSSHTAGTVLRAARNARGGQSVLAVAAVERSGPLVVSASADTELVPRLLPYAEESH